MEKNKIFYQSGKWEKEKLWFEHLLVTERKVTLSEEQMFTINDMTKSKLVFQQDNNPIYSAIIM